MDTEQPPAIPTTPALWNPNAAAAWSLVFTPAFGAFLHARNAKTLGRIDEMNSNMKWFYASLGSQVFCLVGIFLPSIGSGINALIGGVMLLTWFFTLAEKQTAFVKTTYGDSYLRKSWGKPLLIGAASEITFFVVVCGVAMVAGFLLRVQP